MKKVLFVLSLMLLGSKSWAWVNPQSISVPPIVNVSSTGFASSFTTATVTAAGSGGPFSTGLNTYITNVHIEQVSTATIAGIGTSQIDCTTNNLGGLNFEFSTVKAIGAVNVVDVQYANPLLAPTANQAVQIMCPSSQAVIWNINVGSFQGQ